MRSQLSVLLTDERKRQGISASDLGVPLEIIEAFEAGCGTITLGQLDRITRALQLDPVALRDEVIKPMPQPSIFLRQTGMHPDLASADMETLDDTLDEARNGVGLATCTGATPGLFPSHALVPQPIASDGPHAAAHQGYQLARELRRALRKEAGALPDLCQIAEEECGVFVSTRALSTRGASALSIKADSAAAIILNATISRARESFARTWIAHELCHVLFDEPSGGLHLAIDLEEDRAVHQQERRARAFAAELLIPLAGLRSLIGTPAQVRGETAARNLAAMARDAFGSTWQVAVNHLCNHGFIAMELRESLERAPPPPMSREWPTQLPAAHEPSLRVAALTRRAYNADLLTGGEARALLRLDVIAPLPWEDL